MPATIVFVILLKSSGTKQLHFYKLNAHSADVALIAGAAFAFATFQSVQPLYKPRPSSNFGAMVNCGAVINFGAVAPAEAEFNAGLVIV